MSGIESDDKWPQRPSDAPHEVNREARTMFDAIGSYFAFYHKYLMDHWHHMTPEKYGILLICIGVFGWLLMKNCTRASR